MAKFYDTKKYSADKIALLGVLIIALCSAQIVIALKSVIKLAEPVKLRHIGLSVSMPTGKGWKNQKQWKYENNSFNLNSDFASVYGSPNTHVQCRYYLTVKCRQPVIRFAKRAFAIDGRIMKTGHRRIDTFIVNWAYIKNPELMLGLFFGTLTLPGQRSLDIEVLETAGDTALAEKAFWAVAKSIRLEDAPLLEDGKKIVKEIKDAGLDSFLTGSNLQTFMLIKDAKKGYIGFMMDLIAKPGSSDDSKMHVSTFLYFRGRYSNETAGVFQGDKNLTAYRWETQIRRRTGVEDAQITLGNDGVLTISKSTRNYKEANYRLGPAVIPEMFLEFILNQMINRDVPDVIVDLMDSNGRIIPTLIKQTQGREQTGYEFTLDFLTDRSLNQQVLLDSQGRVFKSFLPHRDLTIQSATMQEIIHLFPERTDYILQKNKLFDSEDENQGI